MYAFVASSAPSALTIHLEVFDKEDDLSIEVRSPEIVESVCEVLALDSGQQEGGI